MQTSSAAEPVIVCDRLTMRFGGLLAVNMLSFSVQAGRIHGLIGPNGAGKTTTFNVISGFYAPTSGSVAYRGKNISGLKMHTIAGLGVVRTFQHSSLFHKLTVLENILVGCCLREGKSLAPFLWDVGGRRRAAAKKKADEILDFFGLGARRNEQAENLPHGLQRVVGIAAAMAAEPKVLLLDEPFTGMNAEETRELMELMQKIRRCGVTLLLVEHDMRAVMGLCEKITVVNFGRLLAEGTPEEIRAHPEVIEAYLGRPRRHVAAH